MPSCPYYIFKASQQRCDGLIIKPIVGAVSQLCMQTCVQLVQKT